MAIRTRAWNDSSNDACAILTNENPQIILPVARINPWFIYIYIHGIIWYKMGHSVQLGYRASIFAIGWFSAPFVHTTLQELSTLIDSTCFLRCFVKCFGDIRGTPQTIAKRALKQGYAGCSLRCIVYMYLPKKNRSHNGKREQSTFSSINVSRRRSRSQTRL